MKKTKKMKTQKPLEILIADDIFNQDEYDKSFKYGFQSVEEFKARLEKWFEGKVKLTIVKSEEEAFDAIQQKQYDAYVIDGNFGSYYSRERADNRQSTVYAELLKKGERLDEDALVRTAVNKVLDNVISKCKIKLKNDKQRFHDSAVLCSVGYNIEFEFEQVTGCYRNRYDEIINTTTNRSELGFRQLAGIDLVSRLLEQGKKPVLNSSLFDHGAQIALYGLMKRVISEEDISSAYLNALENGGLEINVQNPCYNPILRADLVNPSVSDRGNLVVNPKQSIQDLVYAVEKAIEYQKK